MLDWVNSRGMTPLHAAALKGQVEAAQVRAVGRSVHPSF